MEKFLLNGQWKAKCFSADGDFSFDAKVPGSTINDLMNCGKLPKDIFWRDNSDRVQDFEKFDYDYEKTFNFEVKEGLKYILNFQRLDTYCDVYLNGNKIATTLNGFISHSFDVTNDLVSGENKLLIHFTSPVTAVEGKPHMPGAFTTERMHTRRVQCTYGWDWVARFVCCSICGDVSIVSYDATSDIRIADKYIYTKYIDEDSAEIVIKVNFEDDSAPGQINVKIYSPDGEMVAHHERYCAEKVARINLDIANPCLWYPLGYGEQPIYKIIITDNNDNVLASENFGIRIVKIMQIVDKEGTEYYEKCQGMDKTVYDKNTEHSGFILKVNGKKIICMGGNWVPPEPFYNKNTDAKVTEALELSAKAGVNMIRIWGGGVFETEHFYDECSRLGIMVTQDFLMACGKYPDDEEWFLEELKKEAAYAAKLARNKACLMWWSGDNENATSGSYTKETFWGRKAGFSAIGPVMYELDYNRDFLPSSPFGGNLFASNTVGTTHNTNFLGKTMAFVEDNNFDNYTQFWKKIRARFVAEEPILGAICKSSLLKMMTEEDIFGDDDSMWREHTKNNEGFRYPSEKKTSIWDFTVDFALALLGDFTSTRDKFFKLKYLQYEWVRLSMEQMRRDAWFSSGVIFWMLNDCWPASSGWAIIDYYNRPKDAYYSFKRCAKNVLLALDCVDGKYSLYASNLYDKIDNLDVTISRVKGAQVKVVDKLNVSLPAAQTTVLKEMDFVLDDGEVLVAEISGDGVWDRTFYRHGRLVISETPVDYAVDKENNTITFTSKSYVHAVEFEGDALFDDNCFSIMPGETKTVKYEPLSDTEIEVVAYTF